MCPSDNVIEDGMTPLSEGCQSILGQNQDRRNGFKQDLDNVDHVLAICMKDHKNAFVVKSSLGQTGADGHL